jgi:outer membrane lipoprotein-sorting protein
VGIRGRSINSRGTISLACKSVLRELMLRPRIPSFCVMALMFLQGPQPPLAENVYLNVQVLKGIPVDQFNDTMGMFSSALLLDCIGCHDSKITSDPKAFAISTPRIQRARQMVLMMNNLNRTSFGGQQRVTCFTCHNGDPQPERSPSLRLQYGELINDPSSFKFFPDVAAPAAEKILARYIEALGGAQRLGGLTSFVATGSYTGFETSEQEVPLQVFARTPDQRAMIAETGAADLMWIYDGRNAWRYQPDTPIPLVELTGWSRTGSRIDTMVFFPAALPKAFTDWQTGYADIDGKQVEVVRGVSPGQSPVNLHFDESGFLVRLVRWNETAAGPVPVQIDYSDYRDVAGVKIPFSWIMTWTNGQSTIKLKDVQPNVAIDNARFAKPNVPETSLK